MADAVAKALMLDKIPIDRKTVLILQHSSGSPFLHSLLLNSTRQARKVCLVAFSQSADYYHSVGTRLGWNFNSLLNSGNAEFIGGLEALRNVIRSPEISNSFDFIVSTNSSNPLSSLFSSIEAVMKKWSGYPVSLVIDELDCLSSLGISHKDVMNFFQNCHSLVQSSLFHSLVVSVGITSTDKEIVQLSSLLCHWSDLVLTERGLETGKSKELTGTLGVNWNISSLNTEEQRFQFKCFDRGIRVFAPGTLFSGL